MASTQPMDLDVQETLIAELTLARKRHLYHVQDLDFDCATEDGNRRPTKRQKCDALRIHAKRLVSKIDCVPKKRWCADDAVYGPLAHIFPTYVLELPYQPRRDDDAKWVSRKADLVQARLIISYSGAHLKPGSPLTIRRWVLEVRDAKNRFQRSNWQFILSHPLAPGMAQKSTAELMARPPEQQRSLSTGAYQAARLCEMMYNMGHGGRYIPAFMPIQVRAVFPRPNIMVKGKSTVEPILYSIRIQTVVERPPLRHLASCTWEPYCQDLHYSITVPILRQLSWHWSYVHDPTYARIFQGSILGRFEGLPGIRLRIMQFAGPPARYEPYVVPRTRDERNKGYRLNREGFDQCNEQYLKKQATLEELNPLFSTEEQRYGFLSTLDFL